MAEGDPEGPPERLPVLVRWSWRCLVEELLKEAQDDDIEETTDPESICIGNTPLLQFDSQGISFTSTDHALDAIVYR